MRVNCLQLSTTCFTVNGRKFEVPRRYTAVELARQGVRGIICLARDMAADEEREECAIEKIEGVFKHSTRAMETLRELRILRHLRHENLMDVRSIFLSGAKGGFEDLYVISEVTDTDLAAILKSGQTLSQDQTWYLLYQTLRGMKYVHSAAVVHRDLEPCSLRVSSNCDLRICGFGRAQVGLDGEGFQACLPMAGLTKRWYRAPETLCSWAHCDSAVDVWSIGCIFAEMLVQRPLFRGCSAKDQLQLIVALLGKPPSDELGLVHFQPCRRFVESLPASGGAFREAFAGTSEEAFGLLSAMLQFSPRNRVAVPQALEHPYIGWLSVPEDEPTRDALEASDFEFERREVDTQALREELFQEALHYYPDIRARRMEEQQRLGRQPYGREGCSLLYGSEEEEE